MVEVELINNRGFGSQVIVRLLGVVVLHEREWH